MKKMMMIVLAAMMLVMGTVALADVNLEEAKQIALDRAGAAAEDAVFTKAHVDHDDGRQVFDIEFYAGDTEYELDVDIATGEITEFETEQHIASDGNGVTLEDAKGIALAHAGFKAEDVNFRKAKEDRDDGRAVFEIEYVVNGVEYEYDIDAATGRILEFDIDRD